MSEWIRFEDQKPEIGQTVIVFKPRTNGDWTMGLGKYKGVGGIFSLSYDLMVEFTRTDDVVECVNCDEKCFISHGTESTHWMPIPEPPKGDKNERVDQCRGAITGGHQNCANFCFSPRRQ